MALEEAPRRSPRRARGSPDRRATRAVRVATSSTVTPASESGTRCPIGRGRRAAAIVRHAGAGSSARNPTTEVQPPSLPSHERRACPIFALVSGAHHGVGRETSSPRDTSPAKGLLPGLRSCRVTLEPARGALQRRPIRRSRRPQPLRAPPEEAEAPLLLARVGRPCTSSGTQRRSVERASGAPARWQCLAECSATSTRRSSARASPRAPAPTCPRRPASSVGPQPSCPQRSRRGPQPCGAVAGSASRGSRQRQCRQPRLDARARRRPTTPGRAPPPSATMTGPPRGTSPPHPPAIALACDLRHHRSSDALTVVIARPPSLATPPRPPPAPCAPRLPSPAHPPRVHGPVPAPSPAPPRWPRALARRPASVAPRLDRGPHQQRRPQAATVHPLVAVEERGDGVDPAASITVRSASVHRTAVRPSSACSP